MTATTEIVQKIHSCTINKNTIKKIVKLLDLEISKIPDEDKEYSKPEFNIRIESKKKTITIHCDKELESLDIPNELKSIRVNFRWYQEPQMSIEIDLGFYWWYTPEIRVSGTDPTWVNGTSDQIHDILIQNPTKNELVHNNYTKIPIFVAISVLSAIGSFFFITWISPFENDEADILRIMLRTVPYFISALLFSSSFIPWFFPIVEFENRGMQKNFVKYSWQLLV